ncbi:MAG: ATP-binding protein [Lachnospiraceae bacterium]|nr:ATP-binding protein [Lachnospiraceae bacterium]
MKRRLFLTIFLMVLAAFLVGGLVTIIEFSQLVDKDTLEKVLLAMLFPSACLITLAFIVSFYVANRASDNLLKPINQLDVSSPLERDTYPELGPLVQKINAQNRELHNRMTELKEEHEKQDQMRREFTANVSHELKTPLTSISGYAEIIRDGIAQEEDVRRFAGKIYDEANRLVVLVGDILRLSRIEDRETEAVWEDIDLTELCKATAELLSEPAARHHITITTEGEETHISGVEQIVGEIVYNLIDNAIKYNNEGGSVTVRTGEDEEGKYLTVEDTGIGIPKADLGRIFERFYRVDKSHSKEVGGTGLGLSIVKHGASFHGATVQAKSNFGKGTTMTVHFTK